MKDLIWMTIPQIYIPKTCGRLLGNEVSETYRRVYEAYQKYNELMEDNLELPVEATRDSDELAAAVVQRVMEQGAAKEDIRFLADCRSSITGKVPAPTYRAAVLGGLKDIVPFSIQNQAGTEAVQAVIILREMMREKGFAMGCVSAVQKLNKGDCRKEDNYYPFGDGAAAVLLHKNADQGFQILDVLIKKMPDVTEEKICRTVKGFCMPEWIIYQQMDERMKQAMEKIFPSADILTREKYREIDFGCADVLISLAMLAQKNILRDGSVGCAVFVGRTGHIGAMVLRFVKGEETYDKSGTDGLPVA